MLPVILLTNPDTASFPQLQKPVGVWGCEILVYTFYMNTPLTRKVGRFIVILITISPLCTQAHNNNPHNRENPGAPVTGVPTPTAEDRAIVEEVIVIGQRPISFIRKEIIRAEDLLFDTFNELNNDDDYDMVCEKVAPIGSQLKRRVCLGRFVQEAETDAFLDFSDNNYAPVNWARMRMKSKRQMEIMAAVATENPQFLNLLKKRWALIQVYDSRVEQCARNVECLNNRSN